MSWRALLRLGIGVTLIVAGLGWIWHSQLDPNHANFFITAVLCAVTAIYALVTFEILLQNQAMAKAATDSTRVMEQSLRFSYAPNLLYRTLVTKDPTLDTKAGVTPVNNEDYRSAMSEFGQGGQRKEFVFAIIQNVGRGAATNLKIAASYKIRDNSNPTKTYSVSKNETIQILDSDKAIALCIYVFTVPTSGDTAEMIFVNLTASDFYRDALKEAAQLVVIRPDNHLAESESDSIVKVS